MRKTLLVLILIFSVVPCFADDLIKGYALISKGQSKEGLKLIESAFPDLPKNEKVNAAYVLSQAEAGHLENSPAYYAKYSLKYNESLENNLKAKLHRILADDLFGTGAVPQAIKSYETALELSKDDLHLSQYIRYKLGWAYVNQNSYEKLFALWSPFLSVESTLSSNFIHDYGKFWMEDALKAKKLRPVPEFLQKEIPNFSSGVNDGMMREYRTDLRLEKIIETAPGEREKIFFLIGLLNIKSISPCRKVMMLKGLSSDYRTYFSDAALKSTLDQCLEVALSKNDAQTLPILKSLYETLDLGIKEKSIIYLHDKDFTKACSTFTEILKKSDDLSSLKFTVASQEAAGCLEKKDYLDSLINSLKKNLKSWPEDLVAMLLTKSPVATAFYKELPADWKSQPVSYKRMLLQGLEGDKNYIQYYVDHHQNEASLLSHLNKINDPKVTSEALNIKGLTSPTINEIKLLVALNSDPNGDVETLASGCKSFSDHGTLMLLNHIIERKRSDLFVGNYSCFKRAGIPEETLVSAAMLGPANGKISDPFINYVNEVLFLNEFKDNSEFNKVLDRKYKSIRVFKEIKQSLGKLRNFSLNQIPAWDGRIFKARRSIIKTEWMNDDLKFLMIGIFNSALDEGISRIGKLQLGDKEKDLLIKRYEGLKFK